MFPDLKKHKKAVRDIQVRARRQWRAWTPTALASVSMVVLVLLVCIMSFSLKHLRSRRPPGRGTFHTTHTRHAPARDPPGAPALTHPQARPTRLAHPDWLSRRRPAHPAADMLLRGHRADGGVHGVPALTGHVTDPHAGAPPPDTQTLQGARPGPWPAIAVSAQPEYRLKGLAPALTPVGNAPTNGSLSAGLQPDTEQAGDAPGTVPHRTHSAPRGFWTGLLTGWNVHVEGARARPRPRGPNYNRFTRHTWDPEMERESNERLRSERERERERLREERRKQQEEREQRQREARAAREQHAAGARAVWRAERVNLLVVNGSGIPRIVHQSWKTKDSIPGQFQGWMQSWVHHNPDWQYVFWDDVDNDLLIRVFFPEFQQTYRALPSGVAQVSHLSFALFGGRRAKDRGIGWASAGHPGDSPGLPGASPGIVGGGRGLGAVGAPNVTNVSGDMTADRSS